MKKDLDRVDAKEAVFAENVKAKFSFQKLMYLSVTVNEDEKRATVYVSEDQQSIAIGRAGQNVRLASRLTGYELDIEAKTPVKAEPKPRKNIEDSLMSVVEEVAE